MAEAVLYLRIPAELKDEVEQAADDDRRSLTREAEHLIRLGLDARKAEGRPSSPGRPSSTPSAAPSKPRRKAQ